MAKDFMCLKLIVILHTRIPQQFPYSDVVFRINRTSNANSTRSRRVLSTTKKWLITAVCGINVYSEVWNYYWVGSQLVLGDTTGMRVNVYHTNQSVTWICNSFMCSWASETLVGVAQPNLSLSDTAVFDEEFFCNFFVTLTCGLAGVTSSEG